MDKNTKKMDDFLAQILADGDAVLAAGTERDHRYDKIRGIVEWAQLFHYAPRDLLVAAYCLARKKQQKGDKKK